MAAHSFHVLFCVVLQNFYAILQKFCTITRVYLKYSSWTWTYYHWIILPRLYSIRPSRPHYEFMTLFDFHAPFSEIINRKRRNIGIRIIIRLIYYPINGYPDSKLSVLSIPNIYTSYTNTTMKLESELKHNGVHEANIKSSRTVREQMLEAESEAKDKSSRPRPRPRTKFWPRGQLGLEDLTSLHFSPSGLKIWYYCDITNVFDNPISHKTAHFRKRKLLMLILGIYLTAHAQEHH